MTLVSQLVETTIEQFGPGNRPDVIDTLWRVKASAESHVLKAHALFEFGFAPETAVSTSEGAAELTGLARSYPIRVSHPAGHFSFITDAKEAIR